MLSVRGLKKRFSGNTVLDDVDFDLYAGETHILFGENGAGKSTFVKILCGGYSADKGEICIDGDRAVIRNPSQARALGIVAVHQDFGLIPQMTVIENLYLGRELKRYHLLSKKIMRTEALEYLESLGLGIEDNLYDKISQLSMEKQQIVAIAKAMLQPAKILILDEPTSSFSDRETSILFENIKKLKEKGLGIIYISHIVEELKAIGDRVTILRDGRVVGSIKENKKITQRNLLKGMIVEEEEQPTPELKTELKRTVLVVNALSTKSGLMDISLSLKAGEILGIGGLPDSRKAVLGRAIFGLEEITAGNIVINGVDITSGLNPSQALENDIMYFPAEKLDGLVLERSIKENQTLPSLNTKFTTHGFLMKAFEKDAVSRQIQQLDIRPKNMNQQTRYLSGGNQQKVLIARGLLKEAKTFIFDEVTRGVDIASKISFFRLIAELAKSSEGVIYISSEISELLDFCHNVIIMHNGRIFEKIDHDHATREKLIHYMFGLKMED